MVRGRDSCWEHCVLVDPTRQKVRCNYCLREFSGGVYRMKFHLAQIKNKDIIPCSEVPQDVRDSIHSILTAPKQKQREIKKPKIDQNTLAKCPQNSSSSIGQNGNNNNNNHNNHDNNIDDNNNNNGVSSGQNESTCPSLLVPEIDGTMKRKFEFTDMKIAKFFFYNSVPLNSCKSIHYQSMIDAIAESGPNYKAPDQDLLTNPLLEKIKGEINGQNAQMMDRWQESGCTILSDSSGSGAILVFSVVSTGVARFLKSVDVSSYSDDPYYLVQLLDSVITEIGPENVVQVVSSYACTGGVLVKKYPWIFFSQCVSYTIEKVLEDISKLDWVCSLLEEVRSIARYFYSQSCVLNFMKKFTNGRDLVRPKLNRFVTHFLTLRSIVLLEDNLKNMFSHSDWLSSVYSSRPDGKAIKSLLFSDKFWGSAQELVHLTQPLIKLLRMVDGDMPAIGYLYHSIERAKSEIRVLCKGNEEKILSLLEIIERRLGGENTNNLHAAAAFLNPSTFYGSDFVKFDSNLRNGFHSAIWKMFYEEKDRIGITKEQPVYLNARGALGSEFAILGRNFNSPGDWWAAFGYEIPVLQRAAIRILSQPCSSYWFRWNWSTFENTNNTNKNNNKLSDLVYVHCNLRLQSINDDLSRRFNRPIVFDEIDVSSEWLSESEPLSLVLDDSYLDDLSCER